MGVTNIAKLKNFVQINEISQLLYWEIFLYIAGGIIMVLLAILGFLLRRRVFNYSNIKPAENSLTIDQNDGISVNNESFIGGDSFHFEYELPEIKKNEPIINEEKLTPITRKYMFDKQQIENEQKEQNEQNEQNEIEKKEKEKEKNDEEIKKKEEIDEKNGFNSLAEENEKKSETNISENKEENEQNLEKDLEKEIEKVHSLEQIPNEEKEANGEEEKKENS